MRGELRPGGEPSATDRLLERDVAVKVLAEHLADDGRWWQGAGAWLTCLWATIGYHEWSYRLATPLLRPLVRKAVHLVSANRLTLSRLMGLETDEALAAEIRSLPEPACADGDACGPANPTNP